MMQGEEGIRNLQNLCYIFNGLKRKQHLWYLFASSYNAVFFMLVIENFDVLHENLYCYKHEAWIIVA